MHKISLKQIVLTVAATLFAVPLTVAQQAGGGMGPNSPTNPSQTPNAGAPPYPGTDAPTASNGGGGNAPQNLADQSFLKKTMEDSVAQVQMGQLAAQKSSSDDVKEFGQKMVDIHQQLNNQLKPVAQKLGVDEPKNPSKKDRQEIAKMQTLSGADFDAEFIRAMLRTQQNDLKGFQDESQGAQDPNVQQVAKMDEPVLNQHLQILQKIAQSHNVTEENNSK